MSDEDKKDETVIGGGPPTAPKLPSAPAAPPPPRVDDVTSGPGAPPPSIPRLPGAGAVPPAAPAPAQAAPAPAAAARPAVPPPAPAPRPAAPAPVVEDADATIGPGGPFGAGEDEGATVIVARDANRPRFALRHEQPPGHSDSVTLSRDAYLIGRSPSSDVRLFSPGASREHARLSLRSGAWYLAPCEGKSVVANGQVVRGELRVVHKMRLQLGEDELLVIDQAAPAEPAAASPAPASAGAGARWWIVVALAAALLVAAAAVWVLSRG